MNRKIDPLHVIAGIAGILAVSADTGSNVEYIYGQTGNLLDSSVAAVLAVAFGTALALSAAFSAFRNRDIITGFFLVCAFVVGATFSLTATADRTTNQRAGSLHKTWEKDIQHSNLFEDWRLRRRVADKECSPTKGGRGNLCEQAETRAHEAKAELEARRLELDATAQAIHKAIPAIKPELAQIIAPLSLPVALFLLGNALLAFGIGGRRVKPEFEVQLTGRAADEAKADRFIAAFEAAHGRRPKPQEVVNGIGIPAPTAKRMLKRAA
jgi:hypothetical protein